VATYRQHHSRSFFFRMTETEKFFTWDKKRHRDNEVRTKPR